MSVEQIGKIDIIDTSASTGDVILTISDPLDWVSDPEEHLKLLQEKLNTYLSFIESGDIMDVFPYPVGTKVVVHITHKYAPSGTALNFYSFASQALEEAGIMLSYGFLDHP